MAVVATNFRPFVLLTGSTGLVGGLVLARLVESQIPVAVLVRGNRRQTAVERVESLMQRLEQRFGRNFVRPVVLAGDLCLPGLGLSDSDQRWISANCGSVIHSAANLLFRPASEHPHNEPYRTNVEGTRHVLEVMTAAQIAELHYVSTAYIAGLRDGLILERDSNVGQQFGNDYECSKVMAEEMLRQSPAIRSLTVYRPSIVIDLHPTTSMRSDQTINSAFAMFQALSQRFGLPERGEWFRRLGFGGEERKNIVTVDWVAAMITEVYRRPALHSSTYHLTSPNGTSAMDLEDGFRAAVQSSGTKLPPRRPEATALIDEHAAPFVAAFRPYFKDDPKFDRTNTIRAMKTCGEADPAELSVEILRDFCLRQTKPAGVVAGASNVARASDAGALDHSSWSVFISSVENRSSSCGDSSSQQIIGLEIAGPGGGQWQIEITVSGVNVFVGAATTAPVRWIASSSTMNALLNGEISVKIAMDNGLLLLESDAVVSTSPSLVYSSMQTLIEQFSSLIAAFQGYGRNSNIRTSEVAHVG